MSVKHSFRLRILAIFFPQKKWEYIWIGQNAPRALQNHIPKIEANVLKLHPDSSILRHFTIEGIKQETYELLEQLKLDIEDFKGPPRRIRCLSNSN